VAPLVRAIAGGASIKGGIYHVPSLFPFLQEEDKRYRHILPERGKEYGRLPKFSEVKGQWKTLDEHLRGVSTKKRPS